MPLIAPDASAESAASRTHSRRTNVARRPASQGDARARDEVQARRPRARLDAEDEAEGIGTRIDGCRQRPARQEEAVLDLEGGAELELAELVLELVRDLVADLDVQPAAQREHAGPGQHRQRDAVGPRRHRGPAAAAAGWRVARDLRQPAHAAGHRRPDVRAADLRDAQPPTPVPILRYVTVSYGDKVGIGSTLESAIVDVLGGDTTTPPTDGGTDNPPTDDSGNVPTRVRNLLDEAEESFQKADEAFAAGKVGQWATLVEEGRAKVDEAIRILNETNGPTDEPTDGATDEPTDEATPSAEETPAE